MYILCIPLVDHQSYADLFVDHWFSVELTFGYERKNEAPEIQHDLCNKTQTYPWKDYNLFSALFSFPTFTFLICFLTGPFHFPLI